MRRASLALVLASVLGARAAHAQPVHTAPFAPAPPVGPASNAPPPEPAESPRETPEPPPAPPEPELIRRGFYAHLALGPGFFYARTSNPEDARTFTGGSVALQVALGGTPARGFVLGGAYFRDEIVGMRASDEVIDGDEPDLDGVGFSLDRFGVFADVFPDPAGGLHFQGFLGYGALNTRRPQGDADDPSGPVFSAAAGYEWRLGRHGHMGVLLRVTYAPFTSRETFLQEDATTVLTPALLGTATFH
jgi:hypothetical protein